MDPSLKMPLTGRIVSLSGGHYSVLTEQGTYLCTARGSFRRKEESPLTGDLVQILPDEGVDLTGVITEVFPRKNALVRPPLANLDVLFLVCAVKTPEINLENLDKLCAIATHNNMEAIPVFTKSELDPDRAQALVALYREAGFAAEAVSRDEPEEARQKLLPHLAGKLSALAGASGVGKSTLIHCLFPALSPEVGSVSEKSQRGKHTTRVTTLYPLVDYGVAEGGFLADTPGFSMLDLERFFFMEKEDLPFAFPEFRQHLGQCRFTKCSHRTEDGCRILAEVEAGRIAPSRHASYRALYDALSLHDPWKQKRR